MHEAKKGEWVPPEGPTGIPSPGYIPTDILIDDIVDKVDLAFRRLSLPVTPSDSQQTMPSILIAALTEFLYQAHRRFNQLSSERGATSPTMQYACARAALLTVGVLGRDEPREKTEEQKLNEAHAAAVNRTHRELTRG